MNPDRQTLNRTFRELGLRFEWDESTWAVLMGLPDLSAQLRYYLERHHPHLLTVYDADFLGRLVESHLGISRSAPALEAHC
ncbi:MAG: hypothetical protein ACM3X5_09435 [Bacillota bacterium]